MKTKRMTRQESRELTRERLLSAAHGIFLKTGYGASKIEDITAEAGFTRGAFYSNFESKDELLIELLRRDEKLLLEPISQILERHETRAGLESAVVTYFSKVFDNNESFHLWAEARLLAGRDAKFREQFNAFMEEERRQVVRFIEIFAQRAEISLSVPAETLALCLISLFEGVQGYYTSDPEQMTHEIAENILGEFFARFVFGRALN